MHLYNSYFSSVNTLCIVEHGQPISTVIFIEVTSDSISKCSTQLAVNHSWKPTWVGLENDRAQATEVCSLTCHDLGVLKRVIMEG